MRKLLVSVSLLGLGQAYAADIGPYKAPPGAPTAFIGSPWDGIYVGGNVGWGRASGTDTTTLGPPISRTPVSATSVDGSVSGVIGGGQIGFNKTWGSVLLGLETDFQATSIHSVEPGVGESKSPWFGTTRLRAGILATPTWLLYATGGVAYAYNEGVNNAATTITNFGGPFTVAAFGVGWTAGAGVEYALGSGWSVGAEYLHADFPGVRSVVLGKTFSFVGNGNTADIARGKINFHF